MSSIIKVNTYQDANGNALFSSDGSGNVTTSASGLQNTPAFFINKTTDQTLTNNTYTKITFDSEVFDTDNAYASDKFTVPTGKGGKYFIGTVIYTDAGAVSNYEYSNTKLYVNGAEKTHHSHDIRNNAGHQITIATHVVLDLSANDYVEVYCRIADLSGSPFIDGISSTYQSYFYGYRLIGA